MIWWNRRSIIHFRFLFWNLHIPLIWVSVNISMFTQRFNFYTRIIFRESISNLKLKIFSEVLIPIFTHVFWLLSNAITKQVSSLSLLFLYVYCPLIYCGTYSHVLMLYRFGGNIRIQIRVNRATGELHIHLNICYMLPNVYVLYIFVFYSLRSMCFTDTLDKIHNSRWRQFKKVFI